MLRVLREDLAGELARALAQRDLVRRVGPDRREQRQREEQRRFLLGKLLVDLLHHLEELRAAGPHVERGLAVERQRGDDVRLIVARQLVGRGHALERRLPCRDIVVAPQQLRLAHREPPVRHREAGVGRDRRVELLARLVVPERMQREHPAVEVRARLGRTTGDREVQRAERLGVVARRWCLLHRGGGSRRDTGARGRWGCFARLRAGQELGDHRDRRRDPSTRHDARNYHTR